MTFKNLFIEHDRSAEEEAWVEEEIAEQEVRFSTIDKQMNDLAPRRAVWYQEFLERISTIGFNMDGDEKVVIKPEDLPVQPEGVQDKVIWKYGIDGE